MFVCRPATRPASGEGQPSPAGAGANDEAACARQIATTLARRAFRRPAIDGEVETLMGFYQQGRGEGDFETGIQQMIARILDKARHTNRVLYEEELLAMTRAVDDVLEEIGVGDTPRLLVLNKADLLDEERRRELSFRHPEGYLVSAVTGEGLEELGEAVADAFERALQDVDLLVPFSEGQTLSELHDVAGDLEREDTADGVRVTARLPAVVAERYDRYANGAG